MRSLHELVYRLSVEPQLREHFVADPDGVAAALGLPLDEDTKAALQELAVQAASGDVIPAGPGWGIGVTVTHAALRTSN